MNSIKYNYYIAGPMSGYKDHNFPAFHAAQEMLEDMGFTCFNPATNFGGDTSLSWDTYMRADIQAIAQCKAIYLLEGWRKSKGACFEYLIAKTLGMNIRMQGSQIEDAPIHLIADELHRIALCGYSRVGKDEVGKWFIQNGYNRSAIGDIIKSQVDPVVQAHLGYSAFTEDDDEKENIREFLVHHGYQNYDNILNEYFGPLTGLVVNTRLYRCAEAERWVDEGGTIVLVKRPGYEEREPKAKEELDQIKEAGLISHVIYNNGTISDLYNKLARKFPEVAGLQEAIA